MARHTVLAAAGLDLLDRVYRTQMLVDLVYSDEERRALRGIAAQARSMFENAGLQGLRLERAIHYAVAGLEILAADDVDVMARKIGVSPPATPDDMSPQAFEKATQFSKDFPMGLYLAIAETVVGDRQIYLGVLKTLARDWGGAPATLRHRLCERVFAVEYPDAPLEILEWLARQKVFAPEKHTGPKTVAPSLDRVSLRAMSLWELDTWRQTVQANLRAADPTLPLRVVMNLEKAVSHQALERVWEAAQRAHRAAVASKGFRWLVLIEDSWHELQYIHATLSRLRTFAPWLRVNLEKRSSAVSDIAAALLDRAKRGNQEKALFSADTERESHARDIKHALKSHGFTMNAQTIYRRYSSTHQDHLRHLRGYYALLERVDSTWPADYADIYQLYEVALTT